MTSIKPLYAICIKVAAIIDQTIGSNHEIVPGQLLKIISVNADSFIIKFHKRFERKLFKCPKSNIKELDDKAWTVITELNHGENITLTLFKVKVNFCIKSTCDNIPSLGAGLFFVLDLIDTDVDEDTTFQIRMKYYCIERSAYCIRGDKLLESLIIPKTAATTPLNSRIENNYQHPIDFSTNHSIPQCISHQPTTDKYKAFQSYGNLSSPMSNTVDSKYVAEKSLIDFNEVIYSNKPLLLPPDNQNGFRCNNAIDPELQCLKNGLTDLRSLTEKEPNGMNEYAHTNSRQFNLTDQGLQAKNYRIQDNRFSEFTEHFTPPSDVYYQENNVRDLRVPATSINVPDAILRKYHQNTENSSISENIKPFQLPAVYHEEPTFIEKVQNPLVIAHPAFNYAIQHTEKSSVEGSYKPFELPVVDQSKSFVTSYPSSNHVNQKIENTCHDNSHHILVKPSVVVDPLSNNVNENLFSAPKNYTKKSKPRKNRRKTQQNQNKELVHCYNCRQLVDNIIELNCQHLFCPRCLLASFSDNLEDAHCPFKNGNYNCNFKLEVDQIRDILNSIGDSLPGILNTELMSKPKANIMQTRSSNKVEEKVFEYHDDDSNEVLYYCKQENCDGVWFVDKTEGRNTYPCPICGTYNCFKCQVIHDNMTCEEYNQHNPARLNNSSGLANRRIEKGGQFKQFTAPNAPNKSTWRCQLCGYSENLMETAVCVICSRTNDTIFETTTSTALEYYRLLELEENENFIPNFEEFECVVCTEMIEPNNGVQLRGCLHNLCRTCIQTYIGVQDVAEIKCPFDGCTNILEDREIKTLVTPQMYNRFLETSLRVGKSQIKNGYQCCAPNCKGFWVFTENVFAYNCPTCQTENCISCKTSHPEINCKTYQQNVFYSTDENGIETRRRLEQMLKTGEAEHCPSCNIIVIKNGGCLNMHCSMCRTAFKWGQKSNKNLNLK